MPRLKLDLKDRLILVNQCLIIEKLYPDEAEHYARARNVLENGYELAYDWYAQHISGHVLDEQGCLEVIEILSMYRDLSQSFDGLADKSGIEDHDVRFPGFDGNNEGLQLGFAQFLIEEEGKFPEAKNAGDSLNSHAQVLETARRMLPVWKSLKHKDSLERADIEAIIAERIHPSRRGA